MPKLKTRRNWWRSTTIPLPAVVDPEAALAPEAPLVHEVLGNNVAAAFPIGGEGVAEAFEGADVTVEYPVQFGRVTAVSLEPRTILAAFDAAVGELTIHQSHQAPHLMAELYALHLGLANHKVRVIAPDVGGAFGIKLHAYPDDFAVAAIAILLGRPVKHVCDRLDAFQSDAHAREVRIAGRLAADKDGRLRTIDADILVAAGAYSIYPRSSLGEGVMAANMMGAPYKLDAMGAGLRVAYQNKVPTGVYRGVGQPLACAATEVLIDEAAHELGLDPAEMRRRNYLGEADLPGTTPGGYELQGLSLLACHDKLLELMDYMGLRQEQAALRAESVYRGIGLAVFLEQTAIGSQLYGPSGLPIGAQDGCSVKLESDGTFALHGGNDGSGSRRHNRDHAGRGRCLRGADRRGGR